MGRARLAACRWRRCAAWRENRRGSDGLHGMRSAGGAGGCTAGAASPLLAAHRFVRNGNMRGLCGEVATATAALDAAVKGTGRATVAAAESGEGGQRSATRCEGRFPHRH